MSKEWFIKEGGQVCFKSDNAELNGWDTQSLVDCLNGKEIKIADLKAKLTESEEQLKLADYIINQYADKDKNYAQQLAESERKLEEYKKCNCKECMTDYEKNLNQIIDKYLNENIKLEQQLDDLLNKIVEEIRKKIGNKLYRIVPEGEYGSRLGIDWCEINRILDTIMKKYGGEDDN